MKHEVNRAGELVRKIPGRGWVKASAAVLLVTMALAGLALGSYLYVRNQQIEETRQFSDELRNGLVESCERNGNPLREVVQAQLRKEIRESRNVPLIHKLFPQISARELTELISEQNEERRRYIKEIEPVDCAALYPNP